MLVYYSWFVSFGAIESISFLVKLTSRLHRRQYRNLPSRPSPNSCGQVQAADIGIMGGPARKLDEETGKMMAVPGCKIFVGGRIGEDAHLSLEPYKSGIPLDDESLIPELVDILKNQFGAVDKKLRKRDKLKKLLNLS